MPRHRASSNTGAMSVMLGQEAPLDVSGRTMPSSVGLQGQGQGEPAQQQGGRFFRAALAGSTVTEPKVHHRALQSSNSGLREEVHIWVTSYALQHTRQHPQRPSPSPQGPSSVTLPPPSTLALGTCWEASQPPDLTEPAAPHTHLHLTPPVIHRVRGTPARNSSDVSVDVGAAFGSMVQSRGTGAGNASAEDGCALSSHSSSPARLAAPDTASVATNADLQPHPNQHQADGPPPDAGGVHGQDAGGGPGGVPQHREAAWDTLEPRLLHDLGLSPTSARPPPLTQPAWSTSSGPAACSLAAGGQPAGPARSPCTSPAPASVALQRGPGSSSSLASDVVHAGPGDGVQAGRMQRKGSSAAGESVLAAAFAQSAPPVPAAGPSVTGQWAEQVQQQQVGWNAMLNPAGLQHGAAGLAAANRSGGARTPGNTDPLLKQTDAGWQRQQLDTALYKGATILLLLTACLTLDHGAGCTLTSLITLLPSCSQAAQLGVAALFPSLHLTGSAQTLAVHFFTLYGDCLVGTALQAT
ncbi:hypothetical protein HaLaN_23187 [Haematococcus lacustris]|uniref:Uncharacterized protein n=1 Tax=Haematococcus lacustris TaxID=44745 RepID=A0A699ZRE8_HAELA|nr:hypothetical protein HaLaN_23187 [Haematococcus lacustris]